ncbi:hypothetical protein Cni_G15029 [Canna indica]|uniref:PHD-type domain-containing protein n=1 Tax=Canna indica TaxID=4628 RepID=A0AAQ3KD44_9LILI|nr:hypothetical protein Cni_G15029 [Canna indica]
MEPVIDHSSSNQGSLEESDRESQRITSGKFADQNRIVFVGDMRVESGTCNVCSAPCSSCMHRIATEMESNIDCESSGNILQRKDSDSCSFIGVKRRSCDDLHTAASETSNLLSGSSSNESYSENGTSKATLAYTTSQDVDILPEVAKVYTDHEEKSSLLPNNEGGKTSTIKSSTSFGEFKNEDQCIESATAIGRSESSLHEAGTQNQPIILAQASESDIMLCDVNVCDICGDAGREELLVTCSRCEDGAEHTYCMRIMLKKVPEGEWLCEECQLKEEIERKRLNKAEPISGTSNVQSLNKKTEKDQESYPNMESSQKLNMKSTDPVTCGSNNELQSPRATSKRKLDQKDVAPTTRKKVCATKDEPSKTTSPRIGATFSRENSFRNLHVTEVKRTSMASSPRDQSPSSSQISPSPAADSRENSFKNLHIAEVKRPNVASLTGGQFANRPRTLSRSLTLDPKLSNAQKELLSPRGSLLKQVSNKRDLEPKVKKLVVDVPQKLSKESISRMTKMPALVKTMNKSVSFKSSGHRNMEPAMKAQSLKSPRSEDPICFKPTKERNIVDRKNSIVVDCPLVRTKHTSKLDLKSTPLIGDSNNKFELVTPGSSKGFDAKSNFGHKEVKKQSSFKLKTQGILGSEIKKASEFVNIEASVANSSATNILYKDGGGITRSSVSPSADSTQAQLDDKTNCTSGISRPNISEINHLLVHRQVTEGSHATQSCQIGRLTASAAKPSVDVSLVDGTGKMNRWKDAVKAAMSREKKSRTFDQSDCRLLINNGVLESSSRSSSCQRNLPLEGALNGPVKLEISDTNCHKTESGDNVEQSKPSTELSCIPGVGDQNASPTDLDELNEKSLTQIFPDDSSLLMSAFRSLTVPEHEFIWQGAFEILRIGRLPEIVSGIQVHLSNFASPKVHEVARKFPCKLQLEEVPRVSLWPLQFQDSGPKENNIALYCFAKDAESYEKSYQKLLEAAIKNDVALKGNIGEVELLIFPSSILPECSQRWNTLYFLWGVFRVRKPESSKLHSKLKDEPCESKKITESLVQELPTSQKHDFLQHPTKELSVSTEPCGARTVKFNSSVSLCSVSSTGPDNIICKAKEFPSVGSLFHKVSVHTERSEVSNYISPKSHLFNDREIYSDIKSDGTKQGSLIYEVDIGKVSHTHTNSVQQKLSRSLTGFSVASNLRQDAQEREEIKKKERLVKIEAESEEKIKEIDILSWRSKPEVKWTHCCSGMPYCDASESTKANMWVDKKNFVSIEDDREEKRMKCNIGCHVTGSFTDQECILPSKIQPSFTSYLEGQQNDGANYNNVLLPESSKCAETPFFPVDSSPARSDVYQNFRHFLPPVDKETPESNDAPDLELALGGKKNSSKKEMLPFFALAEKGRPDELSGSAVDDDEPLEPLSLSLGFPGMERKRIDNSVGKEDQGCAKRPLILFGGIIESFNPS